VEERLSGAHPIFVLPYLTREADEEEEECNVDLERAAILCLSETRRKKPGILSGSPERISCISKLHYPFWGVPWNDRCIVIDGLDILSSEIERKVIPDVLRFTEDLTRCSSSINHFLEALKRHSATFKGFASSKRLRLRGVVDGSLMPKHLVKILGEKRRTGEGDIAESPFLPPTVSIWEAEERARGFIEQWEALNGEVDSLYYAIDVLSRETEHHKEKLSIEIEEIRGDFDSRLIRVKRSVDRRVKALIKRREKDGARIEKASERRLERLLRERSRLEQRVTRLTASLNEALKARKRLKKRHPGRSTTRIDKTIAKYRGEIRALKRKISQIKKQEAEERREMLRRLREVEEKYRSMINDELEKLEILKEARKIELSEKGELMSRIDRDSSSIESQIRELIAEKEAEINALEGLAVPVRVDEISLIGIPFYLVIFEGQRGMRAEVYPPMSVGGQASIMRRVRRMLFSFSLESRMQQMLRPRFPELNGAVFMRLEERIRSRSALREIIFEAARSNNLLVSPQFAGNVERGLRRLEDEGWVSPEEGRSIIDLYTKS